MDSDTHQYPPDRELDAYVATHLCGWEGVRWHDGLRGYIGWAPGAPAGGSVPRFSYDPALTGQLLTQLLQHGYAVSLHPHGDVVAAEIQGDARQRVRGYSIPQTLCQALWRVMEAEMGSPEAPTE